MFNPNSFLKRNLLALSLALSLALVTGAAVDVSAFASEAQRNGQAIELDVPYVPTPPEVVDKMLEMAKVKPGEMVYDLGSGDGRIVVQAAKKYGARGVGIDLDPERVAEAKENVATSGVKNKVEIREGDALKADVSKTDVITLYLLPDVNMELRPKLLKLPKGTRIVSHDFDMGDWEPLQTATVSTEGREHKVYLWEIGKGSSPPDSQKTAQKSR